MIVELEDLHPARAGLLGILVAAGPESVVAAIDPSRAIYGPGAEERFLTACPDPDEHTLEEAWRMSEVRITAARAATAAVVAAAGIMTIPGGLARTTEQAGNVQAVVAVAFALLGGVFVPLSGPQGGALATLELLTPHGWFHEGLRAQLHGSVTDALPAIGVLLAMGVATGAVGLSIARRSLRR